MKTSLIYISLFVLYSVPLSALAQDNAHEYLNQMGEQYKNIQNDSWGYIKAVGRGKSARKIDKRRAELISTIRKSSGNIKRMKSFKGDNSIRQAAIEYLDLTYIVLNQDYAKIMDLEKIAEESYDDMEAYLTAKKVADLKLQKASDKLDSVNTIFAGAHGIRIVEADDKISVKLKKASEAMDYYDKMYLIFFKCYKQEMYMLDALGRNDLVSLEQNRNTLASYAEEGLNEANKTGSFKGDPLMKIATLNILGFYKEEAGKPMDELIDFLLTSDKMQKMKKILEGKKKPSQQEIDEYNKSIEEYNKGVASFNTINESLNKKRNQILKDWNEKGDTFLSKHIP